jgi:CRISPR-associated endonuclease/helicase Cas3
MTASEFYAHSLEGEPPERWQSLYEHLLGTAELAGQFAAAFDAHDWGYIAGLWHDLGKYSNDFQRMIRAAGGADCHIESMPGHVDHSTAGAQHAAAALRKNGFGKAIAYMIAGHHGGLPDGISTDSCLRSRLSKQVSDCSGCPQDIRSGRELALPLALDAKRAAVQISTFIRMLYSALVDADFLDTERFLDRQRAQHRQGYKPLPELVPIFFGKLDNLRQKAPDTLVNRHRERILAQCLSAAEDNMGLFSLTVPTGGGKTLSSMAFALKHAARHKLERIIYVIPFTSIIEQNADVFRQMLGDDMVLEHHSNFEPDNEDHRSRLAAENWDAPVVVTTNVQFFESLFANRSSRCRKLHNIAGSVVILDEVQTLPPSYLLPCLEALKELAANYRTSIVLCSATQPALQKRDDFSRGLEGVREIIDSPQELAVALKRTQVDILPQTSDIELAGRMKDRKQVLCIVNTRKHARNLYDAVGKADGHYHLSALMCPIHRSQKLSEIRQRLKNEQTCRVVSTQLIEAGVDIDFPVVYRSLAGIDAIAQAAGRCNREGLRERGEVFVFRPEAPIPAGHFRQTAQAAESVIGGHAEDVFSLAAIEEYFKLYYWTQGDALDEEGILAMLQAGCLKGDFPFKTVAERFRFIKDDTKPVIIPFDDEARLLIRTLDYCDHPAALARKFQKFSVSIYPHEWNRLLSTGSIKISASMFPVLVDEALYRNDVGLVTDDPITRDPESLIV